MSKKIVNLVVLVPLAIVLVILCVANRQSVTLALNPFRPDDTLLAFSAPFFVFLFLAVLAGVLIGSCATWISQGKHRKRARLEAREAIRWHDEATRQQAALVAVPAPVEAATQLPAK